jgi:hypothetical protein
MTSAQINEAELEEQKTIEEIKSGLEKVDKVFHVYTPDLHWFELQVKMEKKRQTKRLIRELAFFWLVAVVIVTISIMLLNKLPLVYIAGQLLIFAGLPVILSSSRRKRVEER